MKRLIFCLLLLLSLPLASTLISPQPVYAKDILTGGNSDDSVNCSDSAAKSAVCIGRSTQNNPATGDNGILNKVTNIVAITAGIAAVLVIMVGGLNYITAQGDSSKIASAKTTVTYALIGLAVIVTARALINFVVNRL